MDNGFTPGDFILVRGYGFFDRLIQFGQRLRFPTQDASWNHTALVVSNDGGIIEASAKGVVLSNISKYPKDLMTYVHVNMSDEDRKEVVNFARSRIKDGYGFISVLSSAFCVLFGLKFSFGFDDTDICSGLVARALERTNAIFPRDPSHMTPADLAKYYTVKYEFV